MNAGLKAAVRAAGFSVIALLCSAAHAQATYTVQPGDTAYSVARASGIGVAALLDLNNLSTPDLRTGQVLRLPNVQPTPIQAPIIQAPIIQATTAPVQTFQTHTVQPGQTLYGVVRLYGLKAADVQNFNHLSSSDLTPGQVLQLPASATLEAGPVFSPPVPASNPPVPASNPSVPASNPSVPAARPSRHTVQPGQTLFSVARLYNLRPQELLAFNRLSSPGLRAGQVLMLPASNAVTASRTELGAPLSPGVPLPAAPGPEQLITGQLTTGQLTTGQLTTGQIVMSQPAAPGEQFGPPAPQPEQSLPQPEPPVPAGPSADMNPADTNLNGDWRSFAISFLGVPYVYGGQSPSGTDCSGFVLQVFSPLGLKLPRQSAQQALVGLKIERADLRAGDLLFFDTEGRGTVSHVGIYLGDEQGRPDAFISANSYSGRVTLNALSEKYFADRYLWARRILN